MKKLYLSLIGLFLTLVTVGVYFYVQSTTRKHLSNPTIVTSRGTYAFKNTTNDFKTQFKTDPTAIDSIVFATDFGKISFYTPAQQTFGTIVSSATPNVSGPTILYPNIFPDLDLLYTISSTRLLEEFIVKNAETAKQITRINQVASTNNTYAPQADGSIIFSNGNKIAFTLPRPIMYEMGNKNISSLGIKYEISNSNSKLYISKIITDEGKKWLADKKRKYPIAIDLVIDNSDALNTVDNSLDNGDTVANWTSSDGTNTTLSQETTLKQEGTGSVKTTTTAYSYTTLDLMEYTSNANAQAAYVSSSVNTATGGTVTTSGDYVLNTFTASSTLTPGNNFIGEVLVVAGGGGAGGGGTNTTRNGGGGGGGGLIYHTSYSFTTGAKTVTIGGGGGGGTGTAGVGGTGANSVFDTLTAIGGGGGGTRDTTNGSAGGSGGGAGLYDAGTGTGGTGSQPSQAGASGTYGFGTAGANSVANSTAGGGGGAGGAGSSITGGPGMSVFGVTYAKGGDAHSDSASGAANTGNGGNATPTNSAGTAGSGGSGIVIVRYPTAYLQAYSEASTKSEGSYALKGVAMQTTSLNKTLTRTIGAPLDLSNKDAVTFDIRSSRTGSNIKIGLHDSGGTTTEITPNITVADTYQTFSLDISAISAANRDAINQIIITVVNADVYNTFYIDNMRTLNANSINDTLTRTINSTNLSTVANITYWVRSSVAGTYATLGFGESTASEQTQSIIINSANTWEQKTWDISGIAGASRDAVTKLAFTFTANTQGALFYFDDIRSQNYSNSWLSSDPTNTTLSTEGTIKVEGAGSVKVQTTNNTSTTLDLFEYTTDANAMTAYVTSGSAAKLLATGGTITYSGSNKIHSFTSILGDTFSITGGSDNVDSLVIAGGGGGGASQVNQRNGGGGGGGGYVKTIGDSMTAGNYSIDVGAGGHAGQNFCSSCTILTGGANGFNSTFNGHTATGGGHGADAGTTTGADGGSGGGGSNGGAGGVGSQGFNGGAGQSGTSLYKTAGGGGGQAGIGQSGISTGLGVGGTGRADTITGATVYYGGGGGGGRSSAGGGAVSAGGTGGGGAGGNGATTGINGSQNTGGGGGGGGDSSDAGNGGSGIVIISYPGPVDLQVYSSTTKSEGTYSLKGYAEATTSLNKTITRTIGSPINLSSYSHITFDLRSTRTGSNIKFGFHDSGGTTTEITPNITQANTFQSFSLDISNVAGVNKDAIDQIIITIVNADSSNTFYVDNMQASYGSQDDTITRTTAATDLSTEAFITYWVRSSVAGTYATFGFGESAATEQTQTITINQANTWEQKTWDISGIASGSRNAVTKFAFTFTANTSGASFYFDDIQTHNLYAPTLGTASSISDTSIRWNFTDNAAGETGFKVFDSNSSLLVTCASANLSYCDETGLTPNTQYTRKVGAYNAAATVISSGTVSGYTLAAVPPVPVVNNRTTTTIDVNPALGTNPAGTLLAIYKQEGATCNGTGGVYVALDGSDSGTIGSTTEDWQTDATWGTKTVLNVNNEKSYSFCVKAKNANNVETAFSSLGGENKGVVPITGDINIGDTGYAFLMRYKDGNVDCTGVPANCRYIIGLDTVGTNSTNSAKLTMSNNSTLAIQSTDTLVVGRLVLTSGSVQISTGAKIIVGGKLWAIDRDGDGYPANTNGEMKLWYGDTIPQYGRRKGFMSTLNSVDCNDNSYSITNVCCSDQMFYQDADGDTYGTANASPFCQFSQTPPQGYVANNSDCNDSISGYNYTLTSSYYPDSDLDTYTAAVADAGTAVCSSASTWNTTTSVSVAGVGSTAAAFASGARNAAANGLDCDDAQSTVYTSHSACFWDYDLDSYTNGNTSGITCLNSSSCNTATKGSLGTGTSVTTYATGYLKDSQSAQVDCGPNTATAYPGATTCSSTTFTNNLSAQSYDYNCNGVESKATCTNLTHSSTPIQRNEQHTCIGVNSDTCGTAWIQTTTYDTTTTVCGTAAGTCSGNVLTGQSCSGACVNSGGTSKCHTLANVGNQACN